MAMRVTREEFLGIPTNEERRKVARKLRRKVEENDGLYLALNVAASHKLIDLIDPEPELTCEWCQDGDGYWHTECGEIFVVCNCESLEDNNILFCHKCGGLIKDVGYAD